MLYYFDETADQGYVDKTSSLDEYGILAGWAFPDHRKASFEALFSPVLSQLRLLGYKKLHCTEVFKGDNNSAVRNRLYELLLQLDEYVIIHEGAYPLGVKQHEQVTSDIIQENAPTLPEHIKIIRNKERTRLYTTLLEGVIVKLEECARLENEPEVHMVSDKIDVAIQNESLELLSYLRTSKHTVVTKAFDTSTKQRIDRSAEIEFKCSIPVEIEKVKSISFLEEVEPLSFVADFICFELLRHFRRCMKIERPVKFQCPDVLDGFPLKHKIGFLGSTYFTDLVYRPSVDG